MIIWIISVCENIVKRDNSLVVPGCEYLSLPSEPKKQADYLRQPQVVEAAEKITIDWLSIIERVCMAYFFARFPHFKIAFLYVCVHRKTVNLKCCAGTATTIVLETRSSTGKHVAPV